MTGKRLVEHTNDWSIDSKRSMVDAGYFQDDFIHLFSSKKRRAPLINLCYYIRVNVIDKVLRHFMCLNKSLYQVISLGAGFDTTFFRLFSEEKNVKYIEIDLPSVVKNKVEILLSSEKTKHLFHNWKGENDDERQNNVDHLEEKLKIFGVDFTIPTVLLSEVAITYMEEVSCTKLCKFLGETFVNSALLIYEQINPHDGFGQFMMSHFNTIQSPLKSLTRYNQVKDQTLYYIKHGWKKCSMHRVMDLYKTITLLEEFLEKIKIEPFDEWEEFHLTCLHYGLYIATNGEMSSVLNGFIDRPEQHILQVGKPLTITLCEMQQSVKRFSHSLTALGNEAFLLFGGVGIEDNCHKKTSVLQIVNLNGKDISDVETRFNQLALTHMASCRVHNEADYIFTHGGCKSPVREWDTDSYIIQYILPSTFNLCSISIEEKLLRPCHRWRHTAASFGKDVFIFGGRTSNLNVLNDFWKITLTRDSGKWSGIWKELDRGPPGRFSHSCVTTSDGSVIISGGIDANIKPLSDVWKWTSSTGWHQIVNNMSIPRYGHTSHLINNKLILIGGVTFHPSNPGISVIDIVDGRMENYLLSNNSPSQPMMLHNHQSALSEDEQRILIIGGGGNCFSFGTCFNSQIINIPVPRLIDWN